MVVGGVGASSYIKISEQRVAVTDERNKVLDERDKVVRERMEILESDSREHKRTVLIMREEVSALREGYRRLPSTIGKVRESFETIINAPTIQDRHRAQLTSLIGELEADEEAVLAAIERSETLLNAFKGVLEVSVLEELLEANPGMIEARRVLAASLAKVGEHEQAVEQGRRYLRERPHRADVRIRVAQSLMLLGRAKEALAEVEQIEESKRNADVNYAIGRIHLAWKDLPQARIYLLRALEQKPTESAILGSLLEIDIQEDRFDESVARIQKAVEASPDSAQLQQLTGRLALARGRAAEAEAAFNKAIELDPNLISSYRLLAQFYARTGRTGETIETYEKALEVKPDQAQIHHFLAVLYEYGGQRDKAIDHYEKAIKYDANLGEAKNNLAYIYAESGEKLDRALELAQEAKAMMPDNPNAADTLGWVLYRRGVPSASIGYLEEALAGTDAGDPSRALVRHHLAKAYEASGDTEKARQALEQALADHASYVQARRAEGVTEVREPLWVMEARAMKERL